MSGGKAATGLHEDVDDLVGARGLASSQALSVDPRTCSMATNARVALVAEVVHADHIRVRELGHDLAFAKQAIVELLRDETRIEHLDRHAPIQQRIVGEEHHTHSARAEERSQVIAPELAARMEHPDVERGVAVGGVQRECRLIPLVGHAFAAA